MGNIGIGTDIVEVARIKECCQRQRFRERVYSEKERDFFSSKKAPWESMAGNWAAKEAFGKSLGTGVRGFELTEVSCLRDASGCPYLELTGRAARIAEEKGLEFSVSISHTKEYATATVIAYKKSYQDNNH
ncbi:MAG: holo-ACP synthase [Ruminococcus sp.]|nr:holo-ACP synthase [Ruminococcus sp.]